MVGTAERKALKKAALLALDESRFALGGEVRRVRAQWDPRELVRQTVKKHKIALTIAAALAGLGVTRFFMMPRKEKGVGSALRGNLASLAATTLWSVFREPALDFARTHFTSYFGRQQASPDPEQPE
jgi:hypothetical protein